MNGTENPYLNFSAIPLNIEISFKMKISVLKPFVYVKRPYLSYK